MPETTLRPPSLDAVAAARWQRHAHVQGLRDGAPWLHEEVARRMAERLGWMARPPASWVHWAPAAGGMQGHARVQEVFPDARSFVQDARTEYAQAAIDSVAKPWWSPKRWQAPGLRLGLPEGGAGMVWANMALHMDADPQALLARWLELLQVNGFLMFSCLGPDTLRELRALYAAQGWGEPSHEFTDMHDWGDMLVQAGFAEPVMDMERITLSFETPQRALQELRGLGRNLHVARQPGLRSRGWRDALHAAMARDLAQESDGGRIQLTFEVVYGHAFKPQPRMAVRENSSIPLAQMRSALGLKEKGITP
ncbi:biotin synthase [Curvibacter sp. APW13]|uniref:biotin synthase n=1 Tax=Curvibacter sp. APW13 TaxID=3077236 RepID=UPI0028DFCA37|nr:biotin synthase [Curvibacter sp. APW13]MDT8989662.1 biotin synthase [Curvibacter sp. APW13]